MSNGRSVVCALDKGTTWGTAVSVNGSNKGILLTDSSGFHVAPEQLQDLSAGFAQLEYIDNGSLVVAPSLNMALRFEGQLMMLLAMVMGQDSISGAGPEYTHAMTLQNLSSVFGTLCLYDGVTVREIPSFKPTGFTIRGSAGGYMELEVNGIGDNVLYTGQTNTTLSSVTYKTNTLRIPFGIGQIMMNAESSGALSYSIDGVCPTSWEFSIQRQMEQDFTACGNTIGANASKTSEPVDGGHIETMLSLEFPEYTADDGFDDVVAGTTQKCQIILLGELISSAEYRVDIKLPSLKPVDAVADISGPGRIGNTLTFQALKAQSAPTGMTGITEPKLTITNTDSAGYLA